MTRSRARGSRDHSVRATAALIRQQMLTGILEGPIPAGVWSRGSQRGSRRREQFSVGRRDWIGILQLGGARMDRCVTGTLRGIWTCCLAFGIGSGVATTCLAQSGNPADAERSFLPTPIEVPREAPMAERGGGQQQGAQLQTEILYAGTSTRDELDSARNRLPWNQLSQSTRSTVTAIVDDLSLYRRLPTVRCEVDSRTYQFMSSHPDVAVSLWRAMDISEMQMWQTGPYEYECDLQDGTLGKINVLYRDSGRQIVLCEGQFQSPLLANPISASGLMHLQTTVERAEDGRSIVTHTADVFVKFSSQTVETIAKLISPVSFKMADKNFEEITLFLRLMDHAMSQQPGWIEQMANRMDGVLPGRDQELLELTAEVFVDAQRRRLEAAGHPVSLDSIQPPVTPVSGESAM